MVLARALLVAVSLCGLVAPARGSAQSAPFERRPFVVVNGGYGVQGSGEYSTPEGGPQVSVGVGLRIARLLALRAEYGGQWFLRGDEVVYAPCGPPPQPCGMGSTQSEDLRAAHLLVELRLPQQPAARALGYIIVGPSLVWAPNDQGAPAGTASGDGERSAPGATIGFGFGLRAAPGTDRAVRLEARYTALTHAVAATHGIMGLGLGLWL